MSNGTTIDFPDMQVANDLIGDREALNAAWERDGYWYFKKLLDPDALGRFQEAYMEELRSFGVIDPDATEPVYNGASLENWPKPTPFGYEPHNKLIESRAWVELTRDPKIESLFTKILGARPVWVPIAEYRLWPPNEDPSLDRIIAPHQDGFYNLGYNGRTCWIPVWDASKETGGLAVAEGMHKSGYFHDPDNAPLFPFPPNSIPDSAWRTANYEAGDFVLFDRHTPHSGLRNHSDRYFRLSLDVRLVPENENAPMAGLITEVDTLGIAIKTEDAKIRRFEFTDDTYCRDYGLPNEGKNLKAEFIPERFFAGDEILIVAEEGKVTLMRKTKY